MTKLIHSDCLDAMRSMAENSIDSVVTDPPYELGFMGKSWDKSGVAFNPEVWQEVLRVLKPGGHLLAFSGSRTYHRMAVAIEDAGFEIRDQIMWIYGSGFPKSHNLKGDWQGWGTALKPAHEPIVVARKPLIGTVAENVLTYGTGALNIDATRVGSEERFNAFAGNKDSGFTDADDRTDAGKGLFAGNKEGGTAVQGRWPANVIHDGSDEVLELFPSTKSGKPTDIRGTGGIWSEGNGIPIGPQHGDQGSAARFFYCAKASKKDRNEGLDGFIAKQTTGGGGGVGDYLDDVNSASGKYGSEKAPQKNHHPTVKPTDLMRYLCRLVTPPNGTVLDPFMGSGSTGKACVLEGFEFIGIDKTAEYVEIAQARINAVLPND